MKLKNKDIAELISIKDFIITSINGWDADASQRNALSAKLVLINKVLIKACCELDLESYLDED